MKRFDKNQTKPTNLFFFILHSIVMKIMEIVLVKGGKQGGKH